MALIPQLSTEGTEIADAIMAARDRNTVAAPARMRASDYGARCRREVWIDARQAYHLPRFDPLHALTFRPRHLNAARLIGELRAIGCEVSDTGPDGKPWHATPLGGHMIVEIDAAARGLPGAPSKWHAVIVRMVDPDRFGQYQRDGVACDLSAHAQAVVAMQELELPRAVVLIECEETGRVYAERVKPDPDKAAAIVARCWEILQADNPPECDRNRCTCHGHAEYSPRVSCRTCVHATPVVRGGAVGASDPIWQCHLRGEDRTPAMQEAACDMHLFTPGVIAFADADDGAENYIEYRANGASCEEEDSVTFRNTVDPSSGFTSREIEKLGPRILNPTLIAAKESGLDLTVESVEEMADGDA